MNILVLNFEYPPIGGGGGVVTKDLIENYIAAGHTVVVVTSKYKGLPKKELKGRLTIYRVPVLKRNPYTTTLLESLLYLFTAMPRSAKVIRALKPSVIHAHFILPTGVLAIILGKVFKTPYVLSAHGSDIPGHSSDKVVFLHKFTSPIIRILVKNSSATIFPSVTLLNTFTKKVGLCGNLSIIPHGITRSCVSPEQKLIKGNHVFTVSRLGRLKGIDTALLGFSMLDPDLIKEWSFDVLGDGYYRPYLENMILGKLPNVTFHGWVNYKSTRYCEFYAKGSIFVLPTKTESFGISLLEAMIHKCAIITTDIPQCRYLLGDAAVFVPYDDSYAVAQAFEVLLKDAKKRKALGEKAYARASELFMWEPIAKQYLELFNSLSAYE